VCFFVWSVFHLPTCMLPDIAGFTYIYISQGSVVTQLRCVGIFNNYLIASCPLNLAVKEFWKSVNILRRYGQQKSATLFCPLCINHVVIFLAFHHGYLNCIIFILCACQVCVQLEWLPSWISWMKVPMLKTFSRIDICHYDEVSWMSFVVETDM